MMEVKMYQCIRLYVSVASKSRGLAERGQEEEEENE